MNDTTTKKGFAPGTASRQAAYRHQQAALAASRADTTRRLVEAYQAHPDREYALEVYGSMLTERGVDLATL